MNLHQWAWLISFCFMLLACLLSFYLIVQHLRHYSVPGLQRYVVRILWMCPIYAVVSWLSFRFYRYSVFFDVGRDCYEAFVIYEFFKLMMYYLGGEDTTKKIFYTKPLVIPFPFGWMRFPQSHEHLIWLRQGVLQYAVIRPLMTIAAMTMHAMGVYCPGLWGPTHGYLYTSVVNFLSVTVAMYALLTFYLTAEKDLAPYSPFWQLMAIKFVIFFSFWQSVAITILHAARAIPDSEFWSSDDVGNGLQNFLMTFEMVVASILHIPAFTWRVYRGGQGKKGRRTFLQAFLDTVNPRETAEDIQANISFVANRANVAAKTVFEEAARNMEAQRQILQTHIKQLPGQLQQLPGHIHEQLQSIPLHLPFVRTRTPDGSAPASPRGEAPHRPAERSAGPVSSLSFPPPSPRSSASSSSANNSLRDTAAPRPAPRPGPRARPARALALGGPRGEQPLAPLLPPGAESSSGPARRRPSLDSAHSEDSLGAAPPRPAAPELGFMDRLRLRLQG
eukprot:tig00020563_g11399.t1